MDGIEDAIEWIKKDIELEIPYKSFIFALFSYRS
jgi:hypothetical protein